MSEYKITKQQKAYLESLICQRISRDEANKQVIEAFQQARQYAGITGALKTGWNVDKQDKIAFYLIKDPADDQPLLFFSLKCGEVHQPLDPAKLNSTLKNALMLLKAANARCGYLPATRSLTLLRLYFQAMDNLLYADGKEEIIVEDWANEVIEKQLENGQLPEKAWLGIVRRVCRNQAKLDHYKAEMALEKDNIIRTKKTFAAVELVHFCVHAPAKEKWKAMGMGQSLGKTMFWQFIEPKIQQIRELVGCEYLYLFAADDTREGKLCQLYQNLGFDFRDELYVTKPAYDFCCYFMGQEVRKLRTRKKEFLKNYNMPAQKAEAPAAV